MIIWLVLDGCKNFKLACTNEESARNAAKTYGTEWVVKPFDTDFGDGFADNALYKVTAKKNNSALKAETFSWIEQFGFNGYYKNLPSVIDYGDEIEVNLMARDAKDAIDKAMSVLDYGKNGILNQVTKEV